MFVNLNLVSNIYGLRLQVLETNVKDSIVFWGSATGVPTAQCYHYWCTKVSNCKEKRVLIGVLSNQIPPGVYLLYCQNLGYRDSQPLRVLACKVYFAYQASQIGPIHPFLLCNYTSGMHTLKYMLLRAYNYTEI